jgi:hypothetical protein
MRSGVVMDSSIGWAIIIAPGISEGARNMGEGFIGNASARWPPQDTLTSKRLTTIDLAQSYARNMSQKTGSKSGKGGKGANVSRGDESERGHEGANVRRGTAAGRRHGDVGHQRGPGRRRVLRL